MARLRAVDGEVRTFVAANPNTPVEVLARLAEYDAKPTPRAVSARPAEQVDPVDGTRRIQLRRRPAYVETPSTDVHRAPTGAPASGDAVASAREAYDASLQWYVNILEHKRWLKHSLPDLAATSSALWSALDEALVGIADSDGTPPTDADAYVAAVGRFCSLLDTSYAQAVTTGGSLGLPPTPAPFGTVGSTEQLQAEADYAKAEADLAALRANIAAVNAKKSLVVESGTGPGRADGERAAAAAAENGLDSKLADLTAALAAAEERSAQAWFVAVGGNTVGERLTAAQHALDTSRRPALEAGPGKPTIKVAAGAAGNTARSHSRI